MKQHITRATDTFIEIMATYTVLLVAAGTLFSWFEGKDWTDSLWWACVTATTVGYGDISPVTIVGRIIAVILMHLVPFVIAPLLVVRLMSKIIEDKNEFSHEEQEILKSDIKLIKEKLGI